MLAFYLCLGYVFSNGRTRNTSITNMVENEMNSVHYRVKVLNVKTWMT